MTIEERLKLIILNRYGTMKDFAARTGINYTTVDAILRRGLNKASISNVVQICRTLGISVDELADGKIVSISDEEAAATSAFSDIGKYLEFLRNNPQEAEKYTYCGHPLSPAEVESLLDALECILRLISRWRDNK